MEMAPSGHVNDQLRQRWLQAISDLGASAAAEDAAQAFVSRMGCSLDEAHSRVRRAWEILGINQR
jgi:hypothetical protein